MSAEPLPDHALTAFERYAQSPTADLARLVGSELGRLVYLGLLEPGAYQCPACEGRGDVVFDELGVHDEEACACWLCWRLGEVVVGADGIRLDWIKEAP